MLQLSTYLLVKKVEAYNIWIISPIKIHLQNQAGNKARLEDNIT